MTRGKEISIIGGGISGLVAAFHATRLGYKVQIFEKYETIGGLLHGHIYSVYGDSGVGKTIFCFRAIHYLFQQRNDARILYSDFNGHLRISNLKKMITEEKSLDQIEFLISPNPGEELKPLAKIASGGEISRIMLAMKKLLGQVDQVNILIFDEIDTGIGGRIAGVVGEKLMEIAKQRQVLCITHLHQIAARGDNHYQVSKFTEDGRTFTRIIKLEGEERIQEIARMLGGETLTGITLQHARELLEKYSD